MLSTVSMLFNTVMLTNTLTELGIPVAMCWFFRYLITLTEVSQLLKHISSM